MFCEEFGAGGEEHRRDQKKQESDHGDDRHED
jgi:hypothetical protein